MRIALFATSFPSNADTVVNAGACVKDFAEALTDLGHDVRVLTPYKAGARHDFRRGGKTVLKWRAEDESIAPIRMEDGRRTVRRGSSVALDRLAARPLHT